MWADRIRSAWNESIEAICAVGQLLSLAKADLPHGQFTKMIETETRFSARTAQRLVPLLGSMAESESAGLKRQPRASLQNKTGAPFVWRADLVRVLAGSNGVSEC